MRPIVHSMLCLCLGLGLISAASAGDRLSIGKILEHPADYQAKVVTVEGRASGTSLVGTIFYLSLNMEAYPNEDHLRTVDTSRLF
jgi:hypothetical protein